ncbi:glycoside hydrolase family 19 protein [Paenibacillus sp. 481]|uniref:glycoside hydrolase family 19 protein n=1 Tax=Paenibacillus sp. 481 TaxID=2835869 RepID=UPI001E60E019|nr:glycoside hydrolase family 19 protein [Paenibacillus sp. 481]UHA73966.1 chitinase [Paenibacillus sp. 481]
MSLQKYPYSRRFLARACLAALTTSLLILPISPTLEALEANPVVNQEQVVQSVQLVQPTPQQAPDLQQAVKPTPWQADKAYQAGDIVSYKGKLYKARWWTQGYNPETPATNPAEYPWELIGNDPGNGGGNPGTPDTTAPTAPTSLQATALTSQSVTISWTAATDNVGVVQYEIYRNGVKVTSTAGLTFADTGLLADTAYTYTVKALDAAGNGTLSAELAVRTSIGDIAVGQSRVLTDAQIQALWQGIDPKFAPESAVQAVEAALPQAQYEALFPMRIGSPQWHQHAKKEKYYDPNQTDYYSYDNLKSAVREVANIKYKLEYRAGQKWLQRIYRLDKTGKKETKLLETKGFNDDWVINKPIVSQVVDFGTFLREGTARDNKRELAGFLANIAHETGGGWPAAPGGTLRWGLYWNEEVGIGTAPGYRDEQHADYPPAPGKSYHGRGPIQLSWNYNYGLFSSIIYGDKNVLLQTPELVKQDGKLGFVTGILFWMTPQPPKPSCHDIMVGKWIPSAEEKAKGLVPSFGATIMVINGGLEGNRGEEDGRIARRVGHYRDITSNIGVDITGEKLDTLGMQPF